MHRRGSNGMVARLLTTATLPQHYRMIMCADRHFRSRAGSPSSRWLLFGLGVGFGAGRACSDCSQITSQGKKNVVSKN